MQDCEFRIKSGEWFGCSVKRGQWYVGGAGIREAQGVLILRRFANHPLERQEVGVPAKAK